jgi:hypothetical protein
MIPARSERDSFSGNPPQSVLNIGRRQNKRRNMDTGLTVQGGKKKTQNADDAKGWAILSSARNVRTIRTINTH